MEPYSETMPVEEFTMPSSGAWGRGVPQAEGGLSDFLVTVADF